MAFGYHTSLAANPTISIAIVSQLMRLFVVHGVRHAPQFTIVKTSYHLIVLIVVEVLNYNLHDDGSNAFRLLQTPILAIVLYLCCPRVSTVKSLDRNSAVCR